MRCALRDYLGVDGDQWGRHAVFGAGLLVSPRQSHRELRFDLELSILRI